MKAGGTDCFTDCFLRGGISNSIKDNLEERDETKPLEQMISLRIQLDNWITEMFSLIHPSSTPVGAGLFL